MSRKPYTEEERIEAFWNKVDRKDPQECWQWTGSKSQQGYGQFMLAGKVLIGAHVFSWQLANGTKAPKGIYIQHQCNKPGCVNPYHLMAGTQKQNLQYAAALGRMARGERHWRARLSEDDVMEIRKLHAQGLPMTWINELYPMVQHAAIRKVVRRVTWRHI